MGRSIGYAIISLCILALSACAHTTSEALCADATVPCVYKTDGYRFLPNKDEARDTLVVVTFSGGGVRASALAYGTLLALQNLPGRTAGDSSLIDDVDIISSVSGGSVTAGWYAVEGKAGLNPGNRLEQFLGYDGIGALEWRGLNPVSLARIAFTPYQRSDVLANYFADRLFRDTAGNDLTYADVMAKYRELSQPFVILNATDFGHETRFPFTQNRFDLICSDLSRYKLAYAVAASANFPIAFSPIGLQNFSAHCPVHGDDWQLNGPPQWVNEYACFDSPADRNDPDDRDHWDKPHSLLPIDSHLAGKGGKAPLSNGLLELRAAREAREYIEPDATDAVLHLLDGGLVDNLGVLSTLALEDEAWRSPGLYQRLQQSTDESKATRPRPNLILPNQRPPAPHPARYANIKEVLYIVVNARTREPAAIDNSVYPPGLISTVGQVIDTPLDATILDNQNYLTAELQAILSQTEANGSSVAACDHGAGNPSPTAAGAAKPPSSARCVKSRIVTIDFEMIPSKRCRDHYWQIGTTWTLDASTIGNLIKLPEIMLSQSPDLKSFYGDLQAIDPAVKPSGAKAQDFTSVCDGKWPAKS